MMKIARLLYALWVCGPMTLDARAADSPSRNGVAAPPAKLSQAGQAGGSTIDDRDKTIRAGRPVAHEPTQAGPSKGDGAKGRNAAVAASARRASVATPRAAGPLARSNADRLHSLHPAKARGNTPSIPNRRIGTKVAATSAAASVAASANVSVRGRGMPRVTPSAKAMGRGASIGGPRVAAGPGQLGGPATGRNARSTAIDGTQVRHRT
jgi:hypothetical protein